MEKTREPHANSGKANVLWTTGVYLLSSICFERIVYFGISSHITIFFSKILDFSSNLSVRLQAIFLAAVYIAPVLFCYLADTRIGRFNTILWGHVPYMLALICCLLSTMLGAFVFDRSKKFSDGQKVGIAVLWCTGIWLFFPGGAGTIKPNLIVLGGDQFPEDTVEERRVKNSFFNAFYFSQNIGAFVAFFFISTLAVNGIGGIKKTDHKYHRFFYLVIICIGFNVLSLLSVLLAKTKVITAKPEGSVLSDFLLALRPIWNTNIWSVSAIVGFLLMFVGLVIGIVGIFVPYKNIVSYLALLVIFGGAGMVVVACPKCETWLNTDTVDSELYSAETISGYQDVVKTITFLPYSIFFWASYNSLDTTYVLQGCQMKTQVFDWYNMPPTQLSTWNSVIIMIIIPICDMGIYPLFIRMGYPLTTLRKIFIGLIWSAAAMFVAGFLDIIRKNQPLLATQSSCFDINEQLIFERDISILYQIFQFGITGFAEVFAAIAYFDFYHTETPENLRSITQSLNLLTVSLGSIAGATLISIFADWIPDDLDRGHIDYYFFILGGLNLINAAIFVVSSMGYTYKNTADDTFHHNDHAGSVPNTKEK